MHATEDSLWNIVDNTGLEARVTVVQEQCAHGTVEWRGTGDERCNDQWGHAQHDYSFKSPVERTVQLVWLRWHICVVDGTDDVSWWLWNGLEEGSVCNSGLKDVLS